MHEAFSGLLSARQQRLSSAHLQSSFEGGVHLALNTANVVVQSVQGGAHMG